MYFAALKKSTSAKQMSGLGLGVTRTLENLSNRDNGKIQNPAFIVSRSEKIILAGMGVRR
jgi:hypothetical protein